MGDPTSLSPERVGPKPPPPGGYTLERFERYLAALSQRLMETTRWIAP